MPLNRAFGKESRPSVKKICLTGTTVKTIPSYGEAFMLGAELGLDTTNAKLEQHYLSPSALCAVKALKRMRESNCDGIIRLDTRNVIIAVKKIQTLGSIEVGFYR